MSRSVTSFHRHKKWSLVLSERSFYLFIKVASYEIENSIAESRPIMEGKTKDAQLWDESGLVDLTVSTSGNFEAELEAERWLRLWHCRRVDVGQNGVKPTRSWTSVTDHVETFFFHGRSPPTFPASVCATSTGRSRDRSQCFLDVQWIAISVPTLQC